MNTDTLTADDRLAIVDTLYRLGAGIDEADAGLIASALTPDVELDFGPAARFMGIDFPLLTGRDAAAQTLAATVGGLDTTHVVSNPRIEAHGAVVELKAMVEAAHFPPGDHSRSCVMKNRYTAEVVRDGASWRLRWLAVQCAWFDGDPRVLLGQ